MLRHLLYQPKKHIFRLLVNIRKITVQLAACEQAGVNHLAVLFEIAQVLDVSPHALDVPDIDSQIGLMHTLFTLEDVYGLTVSEADGEVCLKVNKDKSKEAYELLQMLYAWKEQADKLSAGEISKDDYDRWRYYYPKYDTTQLWAKVPSQELSDTLVEAFQDKFKKDE